MKSYVMLIALLMSLTSETAYPAGLFDVLTTISSGGKYTKAGEEGPDGTKQSKREIYSGIQDKQLIDSFYVLSDDGTRSMVAPNLLDADKNNAEKYEATLWPDQLTIRKQLGFFREVADAKRELMNYPTATTNMKQFAEKYTNLAKSRGNHVKVYKEGLAGQLFSTSSNDYFRNDKTFIEYSSYGDIVSILNFSIYLQRADTSRDLVRNSMESPSYNNIRADFYFTPGTINKLTSKLTPAQIEEWLIKQL
ncbi:MAG TPA: hypothetical protein VFF26_13605 [Gallionella sp.]|nr:hypothetical protein [Gallionella sp.]